MSRIQQAICRFDTSASYRLWPRSGGLGEATIQQPKPVRPKSGGDEKPVAPHRPASAAAIPEPASKLTPLRELQLVEAYRQGGTQAQDAMAELLQAYQRRVFSICARMVRHRDDAIELTQESLLKVIEGLPSYSGHSKLSTWVIRVAMNCCLSHLRKQKLREPKGRVQEHSDASHLYGTRTSGGELSPGQNVEQVQRRDMVVRALNSLDAETRAVLVLRDVQDLDYQQLSEVLEIPIGTVKSKLFRARSALRSAIERIELESS